MYCGQKLKYTEGLEFELINDGTEYARSGICYALSAIHYNGTIAQWNAIDKDTDWDYNTSTYTVHCTDGDIQKAQ